ncbi:hornerin [Drosophila eugracilis]|uniref:hornerin n=1 Tax=Drosophila eugracilis TaxID=29029 RepID=UPI0007E79A98|nr:hornerin [Drosophila eugracilis]
MYPASGSGASAATAAAKFQNRCGSPQFASDYPHPHPHQHPTHQTTSVAVHSAPSGGVSGGSISSGGSMSMRHGGQRVVASHQHPSQMTLNHGGGMGHNHGMGLVGHNHGHGHAAATLGHPHSHSHNNSSSSSSHGHVGSHLIFPDDMDSIEFCMPAAPSSSSASSQNGLGIGDQLLMGSSSHGEAFTERRRRGHSRRSNHKMDVEQQVKWSRKNIAATMERFEPTPNTQSSSSTSSLDYGFAAGVMTPSSSSATPSHGGGASNPSLHVAFNGSGGGGVGAVGGGGSVSAGSAGASGSAGAAAPSAPFNHVYSYAYYEPGAAKCHTNVPAAQGSSSSSGSVQGQAHHHQGHSKSPPRNSIRALLAKSFRSKSSTNHGGGQSTSSSPSAEERDRHTYTTRYGTTENLYEEVSDQKIRKVLSDNRIASGSSAGNVKEEQRRVQHNHFRVLDELNLSLEALIMPPTPPDVSPSHVLGGDEPSTSVVSAGAVGGSVTSSVVAGPSKTAQRPRRGGLLGGAAGAGGTSNSSSASHASLENLSSTLNSMELKDHGHSSCINPEFDEGDLDSGFSGSGSSSGASYNESLRYYKSATPTGPMHHHHNQHQQALHHHSLNNNTLPHNLRSCRSSTASGTSTSKSSMASCGEDQGIGMTLAPMHESSGGVGGGSLSPFNYPRRCSADQQRASGRSMGMGPGVGMPVGGMNGGGGGTGGGIGIGIGGGMTMSSSSNVALSTGTKPKKNFWTMKP